jgi:hypothetical protein
MKLNEKELKLINSALVNFKTYNNKLEIAYLMQKIQDEFRLLKEVD